MEAPPDLHLRPRRRLLRSKTGCLTCRRRKKKCDEKTPVCGACSKNDLPCEKDGSFRDQSTKVAATFRQRNSPPPPSTYPSAPGGNLAESSVAANSLGRPRLRTLRNATSGESSLSWITTRGDNLQEQPVSHDSQNTIDKTSHVGLSESEEETVSDFPGTAYDEETPPSSRASSPTCSALSPSYNMSELQLLSMARGLNVNPPEGVMHSELLSHYLTETSIAISNGATSVNPFIVQLISLAFTDPLLLQLLLAQAAAHRAEAAGSGPSGVVQRYVDSARTYYTQAIRAYRDALGTYLLGNKERLTILAIGSLTLCVTELARGDLEGASFSHLQAAKSLLMDLVSSTNSVPKKLMSFIVEFYLFNATLSMISMDVADRPHLDAQLQQAGHSLVAEHYVGHLCGCWLSLLMLIPDIVNLKHQIDSQADGTGRLSANCVVTFASLQLKIAQYQPAAQVEHEVLLSGKVYQQTVMLYLLTTMSVPGQPGEGTHRQAIDNAIMQSLEHMQGIPLAARISTTLLWPLTVLGSCTADESMRDLIRARLGSMSETLGFATMRNTLHLLEHIWKEGRTDNGPWTMWRAMRERQIWLLFA